MGEGVGPLPPYSKMDQKIPKQVLISLTAHPRAGDSQMVFRLRWQDKDDIDKAASALGLRQGEFVRLVLVNAAREVLAEMKV